jgi:hypothetical protein
MARVTPEQASAKWAQRAGAATEDYKRGVQQVQTSPGVLAARNADAWLQRTQAAKEKFIRNTGRVDLGSWQQAASGKGASRFAEGVGVAQPKMQQFMSEFLPHLDQGVSRVKAMPNATLEQGIARAAEMIRHNARFKRGGGSV